MILVAAFLALVPVGAPAPVAAQEAPPAPAGAQESSSAPAPPAASPAAGSPVAGEVDYHRAEQLLGWNLSRIVVGDEVSPEWLEDGTRFWYRATRPDGAEFLLVDPARGERRPVFDNARLAAAMSMAGDTAFDPVRLPFQEFEFVEEVEVIEVRVGERQFTCDVQRYDCQVGDTVPRRPDSKVLSPDEEWEAFIHEYDLYIRPADGGDSVRLTDDGEEYWQYGDQAPRPNQIVNDRPRRPTLQWSPDSRRIAVQRMDEREVDHFPMYSVTSVRPRGFTYPYSTAVDSVIQRFQIHVVDVEARTNVLIDTPPQPYMTFTTSGFHDDEWNTVQWTDDGERLFFTQGSRGARTVTLVEADPATGQWREVVGDTTRTQIEMSADIVGGPRGWRAIRGGSEVIWYSQRDGWGHLYRFDDQGNLLNRITEGPWTVGYLLHVDEDGGWVYFTGHGRDARNPVKAALYRARVEGGGIERLTPEELHHDVEFSPSGRFIVSTHSYVDELPVSVLRRMDGGVVMELERADASAAEELGWRPPIPFTVKGRDGVTDVHGIMYLPSHFDPNKRYPVINHIYPGPFRGSVGAWSFNVGGRGGNHALAELGFVVTQMDHMGTNFRSKAFRDQWYGDMGDHGLPDHVAGLRQLSARYDWIDLGRVGIYGHSGGGFASTAAIFQYPDFFHVAVSTAGNHDNRTYHSAYAEKYQGLWEENEDGSDNYESQANYLKAENLKGRLFLMTGDMDDNVHPAMTYRVAHALIEANKDFDFLILPDRAHGLNEPYVIRRRWDYFVEHLLDRKPPPGYEIVRPESRP
jgi:dipeptidyl-peptidase 4